MSAPERSLTFTFGTRRVAASIGARLLRQSRSTLLERSLFLCFVMSFSPTPKCVPVLEAPRIASVQWRSDPSFNYRPQLAVGTPAGNHRGNDQVAAGNRKLRSMNEDRTASLPPNTRDVKQRQRCSWCALAPDMGAYAQKRLWRLVRTGRATIGVVTCCVPTANKWICFVGGLFDCFRI